MAIVSALRFSELVFANYTVILQFLMNSIGTVEKVVGNEPLSGPT
jgi:hypothetical protein